MSSNDPGWRPWRQRRRATGATPCCPPSPACRSIPSAAAARNSMPPSTVGPPTASVSPAPADLQGKKAPTLLADLRTLAEPATGGDPMTDDKFVRRSLGNLSKELAALGHQACPTTVARPLRELGSNLRVNLKRPTPPY